MSRFDAEHLIGQLLSSQLGGGGKKKRRKKLSRSVRGAALSPQGLTLLGGIAIAAFEHFREKGGASGGSGAGGGSGPAPAAPVGSGPSSPAAPVGSGGGPAARPHLPPIPGSPPRAAAPGPPPVPPRPTEATVSPGPSPSPPAAPEAPPRAASDPDGPAAPGAIPDPPDDRRARVLVRAMIEAAKCDGQVDPVERTRILEQLRATGASDDARAYVLEQLETPLDLEGLLRWVGSDPQLAAEVYVASRVVIADASPAEEGYLALLGARLGLPPRLIEELRTEIDAALEPAED